MEELERDELEAYVSAHSEWKFALASPRPSD